MKELDEVQGALLRAFCDAVVPGSAVTGPEHYLAGLLAALSTGPSEGLEAALSQARGWMADSVPLSEVAGTPEFGWLRALVIEAYYSGYRAPDAPGPDGWEVTGFGEAPMARIAVRDFSYLPIVKVTA